MVGGEGAAELARLLGLERVIAADVGGTSFDTSLIADGRAHLMYEATVVGFPVQTPWVDVRSIGAGGGSNAYLEAGRSLRVGPRSAGADPGPACYGRGGAEPTVTDAALVLGMLGRGVLAGGLEMSRSAAVAALEPLAAALDLDVGRVAQGIVRIASAAMANAIREITVERGEDPRRAALLAFGGAGPLFATLLARELGVGRIVIPPFAGNFSAWGMLGADVTRTGALTRILPLDADGVREVGAGGDGTEALMHNLQSGTRITPAEVLESRYPWRVERLALAPDSGGPGEHRGGLGIDYSVRMLEDAYLTSVIERTQNPPLGIWGGGAGRRNAATVAYPDGREVPIAKATRVLLPAGSTLTLRSGGGGGYGDPARRDPAAVERDLREGRITAEHARTTYPHAVGRA